MDKKLTFRDHIHDKINKAYMMLGLKKRNFKYLTVSTFVLLFKNMVRSHLEYWCCQESCVLYNFNIKYQSLVLTFSCYKYWRF